MTRPTNEPWLLTPGPLTTSKTTKDAMLRDWGSRDMAFLNTNRRIRSILLDLVNAADSHECVPVQGSGTFAVEAALGTLIKNTDKTLVLVNGAYGKRIARILEILGLNFTVQETPENQPNDVDALAGQLHSDPAISHVVAVHCETTSGLLNPIAEIADAVAKAGRKLIIDGMSAFGALPIDARDTQFEALIASSNKCLEGIPGLGFALIEKTALANAKGTSRSLCLDLFDQWQTMESNAQWRFTPPTHVIAALDSALSQLIAEGGPAGRLDRYKNNCRRLVNGMRALGFATLLPDTLQAPIIITFKMPTAKNFIFSNFYDHLKDQGYVIYPGKLTIIDSFRMGCIGHLTESQMSGALSAVEVALQRLGVAYPLKTPSPTNQTQRNVL